MPMTQTEIGTFNANLLEALPRLRVYALSLTRDRDRAENLVPAGSPVLEARGSLLRANREPCRNCGGHCEKPHLARSYSARATALGQG
jgi:hypothetical protein